MTAIPGEKAQAAAAPEVEGPPLSSWVTGSCSPAPLTAWESQDRAPHGKSLLCTVSSPLPSFPRRPTASALTASGKQGPLLGPRPGRQRAGAWLGSGVRGAAGVVVETYLCSCSTRSRAFLRDSSSLAIYTQRSASVTRLTPTDGADTRTLRSDTRGSM